MYIYVCIVVVKLIIPPLSILHTPVHGVYLSMVIIMCESPETDPCMCESPGVWSPSACLSIKERVGSASDLFSKYL